MKTIKLLLVDDSEIHLEGLKYILSSNEELEILGEAYTVGEAKALLRLQMPDVILLDISLEEKTDGLEFAEYLRQSYPKVAVIILSHYKDLSLIVRALKARVQAYLAKDTKPKELVKAIRSVVGNMGLYLGDTLPYDAILKIIEKMEYIESGKPHELSDQEIKVLKSLADGNSSKQVAEELHISVTTVESYKERIKNKFGCDTVVEMVVYAIKNNIIAV